VGTGEDQRRHRQVLFETQKTQFQGLYTLPTSVYEWPFEFTFPEKFEVDTSRQFRNNALFNVRPQLLPPSCQNKQRSSNSAITHKLAANIPRRSFDLKDKLSLNFTPTRLGKHPEHNPTTSGANLDYSFKIREDGLPRPLSIKESLHDMF
jgi:hypothetical protein